MNSVPCYRFGFWMSRPPIFTTLLACAFGIQSAVACQDDSGLPTKAPEIASDSNLTDTDQIASLQQTIEMEEARVRDLESELTSPESEYAEAEREFQEFDRIRRERLQLIQQFRLEGKTQQAAVAEKELKGLERQWALARERFELAIEERKALREEITTVRSKIKKDREALDELTGNVETPAESPHRTARNAAPTPAEGHDHKESLRGEDRGANDAAPEKAPAESVGTGEVAEEEHDEELVRAQTEAELKDEEAEEAKEEVREIGARIEDLQKIAAQEQKILAVARRKADLATKTQNALEEELSRRMAEGAGSDELQKLHQGITRAKQRISEVQADITESTDRLNRTRAEQASLQQQQIVALQESEKRRLEAEAARQIAADLANPFAPRNILKWAVEHGPKVLLYLAAMFALLQGTKIFSHRIIHLMTGSVGRGSTVERENRAKTLVGVFQNAASVTIILGGSLTILEELGAEVGVLLGGVAVVGLAVAFGAQNLIKDYFYGFVMLLENQYILNDMVRIGDLSGQVERITLRMTVLRDANGVVHFIPNGQINSVSNETHGWSRAVFEIGVAYKEDVDRAIKVLQDLSSNLRQDVEFGPMIVEDPTLPAVDQLGDSAVILKFFIKTRPNQHNLIRRELLRRIKNRFDELGIEIPFPQRTVYHRYEDAATSPPVALPGRKVA